MFRTPLRVQASNVAGYWFLTDPLVWDDGITRIEVPRFFVTDLASIPAPMRGILDTNGRSRRAAVLHDHAYAVGAMTRKEADQLFLRALMAEGVISIGRGLYYLGVRAAGWVPFNRYRRKEKVK